MPSGNLVRTSVGLVGVISRRALTSRSTAPGTLDNGAAELNARPRKRHGYLTPADVLTELRPTPLNHTGVALTT